MNEILLMAILLSWCACFFQKVNKRKRERARLKMRIQQVLGEMNLNESHVVARALSARFSVHC